MSEVGSRQQPRTSGDGARAKDSGGPALTTAQLAELAAQIKTWGIELGFGAIGVADVELSAASDRLRAWLDAGRHGTMAYMARHAHLRADPSRLLARAARVITARLDYLPASVGPGWVDRETQRLAQGDAAVVSLYARGRDYHKILRRQLRQLAARIEDEIGPFGFRVCTDSAPVFEVELARKSGIGWRGKHTLLLAPDAGSMFFLGEILTDLPLPVDAPTEEHCGTCSRCIEACPTGAITAPYELDARRCISYLTIEHVGPIPESLRPLVGNRVYGCDDCQLACPWNKFAHIATLPDFDVRHGLDAATLVELFAWTKDEFAARHAGSSIRRIGYVRWLRNIAVALGNAPRSDAVIAALRARADHPSALVREHVGWALRRQDL